MLLSYIVYWVRVLFSLVFKSLMFVDSLLYLDCSICILRRMLFRFVIDVFGNIIWRLFKDICSMCNFFFLFDISF